MGCIGNETRLLSRLVVTTGCVMTCDWSTDDSINQLEFYFVLTLSMHNCSISNAKLYFVMS